MAKSRVKATPKTFRGNFTFGSVMAESDPLLSEAYWDNGDYEVLASAIDPRCFVIGRTGSGKSAAFQHLKTEYPQKVVEVIPENLSLPYLTNLNVIHQLRGIGVHLEPFLRALWKHVFLVELLKFRYNIDSPQVKQRILAGLRERFSRNSGKRKALEYVDEFGDKFWCETDERVKQIAEGLEKRVLASGEMGLLGSTLSAQGEVETTASTDVKAEVVDRYQKIINDVQIPRLNAMMDVLNDEVFPDGYPLTYLLIDDLDKDWVENDILALMIRCLFETVIEMKRVKRVKILVALRTNLFEFLNYHETHYSGQEEKVRGLSIRVNWTDSDIRSLLNARAQVASRMFGMSSISSLNEMLPRTNRSRGDPIAHILSDTMMRPRDAILFLNACVRLLARIESLGIILSPQNARTLKSDCLHCATSGGCLMSALTVYWSYLKENHLG